MERRDAGFLMLGAGIVVVLCCLALFFDKSGNVMILEPHERTAIKAHRQQKDSLMVVVGEKELSNKIWDLKRSNSNLIIKDLGTKQLNDQARIDIIRIMEDKIVEKKKTSYAVIKLDDLVFMNLEHPRNNDLFNILNFEDNGKYWKHPKKKEIDKAQWAHYIKNHYEAPRERYFTIDIPEMDMLFVAYESGTRLQMIAVEDCPGVLNIGDEDTSRNLLISLKERAIFTKKVQERLKAEKK